jgi:hypothetical protein
MKKSKIHGKPPPKFYVSTFNLRTLSTKERFLEFENAISKVHHDVVGLCEVKMVGQKTESLNGNVFHYFGKDRRRGSVGFFIKGKWADNIELFKDFSDRVTTVVIKMNEKERLAIIQCYAPTSAAPDTEMDVFYDDVQKAITELSGCTWLITMGDFNSKVGLKNNHEEDVMGNFGYGQRNERGDRLISFLRSNELFLSNSMFKKRNSRKWTWESPDRKTRNEIDFICIKTAQKTTVKNVEVLNKFCFHSDHRMVRMSLDLNIKRKFHFHRPRLLIGNDVEKKKEFKTALESNLSSVDLKLGSLQQIYSTFEDTIQKAAECFRVKRKKQGILSEATKKEIEKREELLRLRNNSDADNANFTVQRKKTAQLIRRDERDFVTKEVETALTNGSSLKTAKNGAFKTKSWIQKLKNDQGMLRYERSEIIKIATNFFQTLYSSKLDGEERIDLDLDLSQPSDQEEISVEELKFVVDSMKSGKATGADELPIDLFKLCSDVGLETLSEIFNLILEKEEVPVNWCESEIILLFKSGDKCEIGNYRPISLIPHLCKLFMKVLMFRIGDVLNKEQPPEQAGFRSNFSTIDHIFTMNQIIEKCNEYKKIVYIAFIDYQKAFDSLEHIYIWRALQIQGVDAKYIRIIKKIYENARSRIKLEKTGDSFEVKRGVRQGDPLSPKIFNAVLQMVFSMLEWESKGLNVNNRRISNLRFADDVTLLSESKDELVEMIGELKKLVV